MQVQNMQASGIYLKGQKYRFVRYDDEDGIILGKLKDYGAVSIQKSTTAIVMAHTKEGAAQGTTNEGLKKVVEYLKSTICEQVCDLVVKEDDEMKSVTHVGRQ